MNEVAVRERVTARAIAATPAQLDALATKLADILAIESLPEWDFTLSGSGPVQFKGSVEATQDRVDLSDATAMRLAIGSWRDGRRLTLDVTRVNITADVWGESSAWAREAAARVRHQLAEMRPWWWVLRTPLGVGVVAALIAVIVSPVLSTVGLVWYLAAILVGLGSALVAGVLLTFLTPALRVGQRVSLRAFLRKTSIWLTGAVVGAVISGVVTALWFTSSK